MSPIQTSPSLSLETDSNDPIDFHPPDLAPNLPSRSVVLILFVLVMLAYFPAYRGGFVFDDRIYLTENDQVRDPGGLGDLWRAPSAYAYHPLTLTTFWLEYRLWRLEPMGYHVVNVFFHALSTALFFLLLRSLGIPGAFLAASVYGLHPLCVESAAWISERKNVLSQSLVLASALFWFGWDRKGGATRYAGALACFTLSLLAKITTAPFPFFILLVYWWRGEARLRERFRALLPFFAVAIAVGSIYIWIEKSVAQPTGPEFQIPFSARSVIAGKAVWFYGAKLVWPLNLMTIYPRWPVEPGWGAPQLWPLSVVGLLAVLWFAKGRIGRGPFTLAAIYVLALVPSLGFIVYSYMRFSFVADHFQYLACLAPIAGFGSLIATRFLQKKAKTTGVATGGCLTVLTLLALLTWNNCYSYEDDLTLWRDNVEKNPDGIAPRDHLAKVLIDKGEFENAYRHYSVGVEKHPDSPLLRYGLAMAAGQQGDVDRAIAHLRETIEIDPTYTSAHHNLAVALGRLRKTEEAEYHFRKTFELDPESIQANRDYASFLMNSGRHAQALEAFDRCLSLDPADAPSHFNLGLMLTELGRHARAIEKFERALEISPDEAQRFAPHLARAYRSLGVEKLETGNQKSATDHLEKSLELWPRVALYRAEIAKTKSLLEKARNPDLPSP